MRAKTVYIKVDGKEIGILVPCTSTTTHAELVEKAYQIYRRENGLPMAII